MAQTLGSTVYVSMKAINVSENEPFYPFIIINLVGLLVFVVLLTPPEKDDNIEDLWSMDQELEIVPLIVGSGAIEKPQSQPTNTSSSPKSRKRNMHLSLCKKADMFANKLVLFLHKTKHCFISLVALFYSHCFICFVNRI